MRILKKITVIVGLLLLVLVSCTNNVTFVQVSDPQFGFISENKGIEEETALYSAAVERINKEKPDAVFITGDLIHDRNNKAQWDGFLRITSNIHCKNVFITPGNHDMGQAPVKTDIDAFVKRFGYDRFSFKYRGNNFIGFNSNLVKAGTDSLEKEQFTWLREKLSDASGSEYIFLFCHHPFFIGDPEEPEEYFNINPVTRKKYLDLFSEYGVDAVFAGHLHRNAYAEAGKLKMITTSSAGKQLGDDPPGFRVIKVRGKVFTQEYIPSHD